jgi:hypothetical protein
MAPLAPYVSLFHSRHRDRPHARRAGTDIGGYRVDVTEEQLNGAPKYASESGWDWMDQGRTKAVDDYYKGLT